MKRKCKCSNNSPMTSILKITDCEIWKGLQRSSSSNPLIYRWAFGGPERLGTKKNNWYLENHDGWATIELSLKNQICPKAISNRVIKNFTFILLSALYFIALVLKCGPWTNSSSSGITWSLTEMQDLVPCPRPTGSESPF